MAKHRNFLSKKSDVLLFPVENLPKTSVPGVRYFRPVCHLLPSEALPGAFQNGSQQLTNVNFEALKILHTHCAWLIPKPQSVGDHRHLDTKNSPSCQNQDGERKGEGSLSFQTDDALCAVQRPRAYGGPRGHLLHPTSHAGTVPKEEVCDDGLKVGVEPTEKSPQTVTCLRGLRYSIYVISVAGLAAAAVNGIHAALGNVVKAVGKTVDEVVGDTADAEEHHACYAEE